MIEQAQPKSKEKKLSHYYIVTLSGAIFPYLQKNITHLIMYDDNYLQFLLLVTNLKI